MTVKVGNDFSKPSRLYAGVPQGSHLGPLLFNISIDSLPSVTSNQLSLFADDSNILHVGPSQSGASFFPAPGHSLPSDINSCLSWARNVGACFNPSKTVLISVHPPHSKPPVNQHLSMDGFPLQPVDTYRHLGVTTTPTLNFDPHINSIIN